MRKLPQTFALGSFTFRLIKREGDVALLEKSKPSWSIPRYEVVIVQETRTWSGGVVSPAHEELPGSWQWGSEGWSYSDPEDAWQKFHELTGRGRPGRPGEVASPMARLDRLREALELKTKTRERPVKATTAHKKLLRGYKVSRKRLLLQVRQGRLMSSEAERLSAERQGWD
jgi:hypothetical protein